MKILFFTRSFWPKIGGVEKHILFLSKELIKQGHEITVVTEWSIKDGDIKEHELFEKINIYRIPVLTSEKNKKFQIWFWLLKHISLISQSDVVHCHDVFYWYLPFLFLYPGKNVYTTFHGYEGSYPLKRQNIFMHQMAGYLSNKTLAIGDFHQKWYKVKSESVSYGAVEKLPLNKEENKLKYDFCFLGRLASDTGIMEYLTTLKLLKNKYSLVVCGDGPQMEMAKKFVKQNKLKVSFVGFVNNPLDFVRQSKFVFVSGYLGILETLMEKKLIFAIYSNSLKHDYLTLTPFAKWLVIEKDPVALAKKISYFATRPGKSQEMVTLGFAWAKQQTWDKLTNQYLALWEKLKFR